MSSQKTRKQNNRQLRGQNRRPRRGRQAPTGVVQAAESSMGSQVLLGSYKVTDLKYCDLDSQRTNPAASYLVYSFRINDVYDPDPLILTGGITGFAEFSAFFSRYHVQNTEIDFTVVNQEAFPITVGVVFAPSNLASIIGSRASAINAMERWGAIQPFNLGHSLGMDRHTFPKMRISPASVLGNPSLYNGEDSYCGFYNSSPASMVYMSVVLVGPPALNLTNGVFSTITLRYKTRFFSIQPTLLGRAELEVVLLEYAKARQIGDLKKMKSLEHSLSLSSFSLSDGGGGLSKV